MSKYKNCSFIKNENSYDFAKKNGKFVWNFRNKYVNLKKFHINSAKSPVRIFKENMEIYKKSKKILAGNFEIFFLFFTEFRRKFQEIPVSENSAEKIS